jgi:GDP-L-fucose synthase
MIPQPIFEMKDKRVWVAGHTGMVGSAVVRRLETEPIAELITAGSSQVDLRRQDATEKFVTGVRPDVAVIAAARVGGIHANRTAQARFLYENLMIAANAIEACRLAGVEKAVVLGSSCIYPKESVQPIGEDQLLTGPLEETNEGYAIAKIAALEMAKMYRRDYGLDLVSLMPTNLYGPGDNYDLETSHVLPALLRKVHEAKESGAATVEIWGTGTPKREFLFVDDLADGVVFSLKHYSGEGHLNVGTGQDISIGDLARLIAEIVGWEGEFSFNTAMPDGTMRKLLDVSALGDLGWRFSTELREGIEQTYRDYVERAAVGV